MIDLKSEDIENYKKKGWCIVKSGLSYEDLLEYKKKVQQIVQKSIKTGYRPGRIYFDYFNSFNLAAVEAPLNNLVCNEQVLDFFKKINLGSAVKKIMGWDIAICKLIRLFCMGNYNYSGSWHQDLDMPNQSCQISIIFENEKGFKIINKKNRDVFFDENSFYNKNNRDNLKMHAKKNFLPTILNDKNCEILKVNIGDIVIFEPYLLHKGSSNGNRLQFHMRFNEFNKLKEKKIFKSKNIDYYFDDIYNFSNNENELINSLPTIQRSTKLRRFRNSINYYFPIKNFIHYLRQKKENKNFKYELFANTAYQDKIRI
jgi:hypothetical protein